MLSELRRMGASKVILSTNIPLRNDGLPYAKFAQPSDPGVAIYFELGGQKRSLACDQWDCIEDNVHALRLTIEAMRGLDRWGASDMLDRVFTGFAALPPPSDGSATPWWITLGVARFADLDYIEGVYRHQAKLNHPDRGGDPVKMAQLNRAIEAARLEKSNAGN